MASRTAYVKVTDERVVLVAHEGEPLEDHPSIGEMLLRRLVEDGDFMDGVAFTAWADFETEFKSTELRAQRVSALSYEAIATLEPGRSALIAAAHELGAQQEVRP